MRRILLALVFVTGVAFADSVIDEVLPIGSSIAYPFVESKAPDSKAGFRYVRFAVGERAINNGGSVAPGLGLGYRRRAGRGAGDISVNGLGYGEHKNHHAFWTAPRASYLRYTSPEADKSAYIGTGLAWGGLESRDRRGENEDSRQKFIGLIPSVSVGMEFARTTSILGFADLSVSQPAAAVSRSGRFPGPIVEATVGLGF